MMVDARIVAAKKAAHLALINENPVSIAIHRVERVDDGAGGYTTVEADLPPFTGRLIAESRARAQRETPAGIVELAAWTLLAPAEADVQGGAGLTDTFVVDGRPFEVVSARILAWKGVAWGKQAECVEIV